MAVRAELLTELLKLPENERADVAATLLASLDGEGSDEGCAEAWEYEIDRRAKQDDDESVTFVDGPEALRQVRAELAADRW